MSNNSETSAAASVRLWIGGTSGLARTYCNAFLLPSCCDDKNEHWIFLGREKVAPPWMIKMMMDQQKNQNHERNYYYVPCDLTDLASKDVAVAAAALYRVTERLSDAFESFTTLGDGVGVGNNDGRAGGGCGAISIGQIVVGIRPPLVTHRSNAAAGNYCDAMLQGLRVLLEAILIQQQPQHTTANTANGYKNCDNAMMVPPPPLLLLHISSIAAVDHVQRQHVRSAREVDPPSSELLQPYDRFKRGCEELVESLCNATCEKNDADSSSLNEATKIRYTSLRFGAIFSDDPACIQCRALALQCYTGPYLPTPIDCNSSRNAAHLIRLILLQQQQQRSNHDNVSGWNDPTLLRPVYYYTRCVSQYPDPVPYGEFLTAYRRAYSLHWLPMVVPILLVEWCVVRPLHWLTAYLQKIVQVTAPLLPITIAMIPFMESVDYLLQVTLQEHTFDMTETVHDFPEILQKEETMLDCFRRRRLWLASANAANSKEKTA